MADSRIVKIHKKIVELIGVDYSAKFSGIDMTGRVIRGSVVEPPYTPFACCYFDQATEEFGPTLGRFQYIALFDIMIFIGGADQADRFDNATNVASDMIEALTANRQLTLGADGVDDVLCSFTAIDGEKFGLNEMGVGYIQIEVSCVSDTGS
tara:strand:- start:1372 stop:1827 length:456 start_codon:yes stop_codon:yes gene_type:complete